MLKTSCEGRYRIYLKYSGNLGESEDKIWMVKLARVAGGSEAGLPPEMLSIPFLPSALPPHLKLAVKSHDSS